MLLQNVGGGGANKMHYGRCASGKLVLFSQIVLMLLLIFVKRQSAKDIDSNNSFWCGLMYYTLKNFLIGIYIFSFSDI